MSMMRSILLMMLALSCFPEAPDVELTEGRVSGRRYSKSPYEKHCCKGNGHQPKKWRNRNDRKAKQR